ncbi:MAG TPA: CARDB domain-containing protein [Solirubrobacterales bacterium]|nr:CARDB domain-containing protein [Solirubrobacterales bacterium]
MDFFDEDDPHDPPRDDEPRRQAPTARSHDAHPHGGPPATKQQARVRQAGLLLGAIVLLILIVIAFRGCLDARKDRSYENYVSDLSSIAAESDQLSSSFFDRLEGKGGGQPGDISFEGEVAGDKGTAQALLDRAQGLDAPDDIKGAQEQVELAFELRHDAIEGIANQLAALGAGGKEADKAERAIYTQMKVLSASDILYARARDQIEQALADNDITVDEGVPDSKFLPDEPDYLDPSVTAAAFGGVAGGGGTTASDASCKDDGETHGLGLVDGSTLLQPSGTALPNGGSVTAVAGDDEIEVAVQNQGTADESDITVDVSSDTGISESGTIDQIAAGETQTVSIPLQPAPKAGETVTLDVAVATVPCEEVADNNEASFTVTF